MVSTPRNQREGLRMTDGIHRQVHVQAGPVQMIPGWALDVGDLLDRCGPEPGELLERKQQLLVSHKEPEAVSGDVRDLRGRNDGAMHLQFPSGGPGRPLVRQRPIPSTHCSRSTPNRPSCLATPVVPSHLGSFSPT